MNVYFILHYRLFFRKEIYSLECFYFSEYDIRMFLFVFWLRKGQPIKYVRNWRGYVWPSKMRTTGYRGRGVTPHVYLRTYAITFHVFGSILVLQCLALFVEI